MVGIGDGFSDRMDIRSKHVCTISESELVLYHDSTFDYS